MAGFGRHEQPPADCTQPWWNRPVHCYFGTQPSGETEMATQQQQKKRKGQTNTASSKPGQKKVVATQPKAGAKAPGASKKVKPTTDVKPESVEYRESQTELPETVSGERKLSKRMSDPYGVDYTLTYPQHVDLVTYSAALTPAGDIVGSNSLAADYFISSRGARFLIDVEKAYRRTPATAFTIAQLQEYINTVTAALAYMVATRNHIRHLYWNKGRQNLNERLALIYDENIRNGHLNLANELSAHFIPPKVVSMVEDLYKVYSIDVAYDVPDFQIVPWTSAYNTSTAYETGYGTLITALRGITNLNALRAAFASNLYEGVAVPMEQLNFGDDYINPDNFLDPPMGAPEYSVDYMDLWGNLPRYAYNVGVTRQVYANLDTSISMCYFGKGVTAYNNALAARYITSSTRFQPGILVPAQAPSAGGDNNFKYINAAGEEIEVDTRTGTVEATILGILARNVENVYCVDFEEIVLPSGSGYSSTSMRNIGYDANQVMDEYLS